MRMAKIKCTVITPNSGENLEKLDRSYIACGTVKWYNHSRKKSMTVSYKTIYEVTNDPAVALLGI